MENIQVFTNERFGQVRGLLIDGEPWFVGKDVADALGYSNTKDALSRHVDPDDRSILQRSENTTFNTPNRGVTVINESGLYSLILSSKLPTAREFKRWVTAEVLPSIRKHGAYLTPETIEAVILNPDTLLRLAQRLKEETDARKKAEEDRTHLIFENSHNEKKVQYFDACVEKNTLTGIREAAKLFGVKEKKFVRFLLENRYLYRGRNGKLLPYATMTEDLFAVKEVFDEATGYFGIQTFLTPRGRETLRLVVRGQKESGIWGKPSGMPREMTEREKADMEAFYEREARKNRK